MSEAAQVVVRRDLEARTVGQQIALLETFAGNHKPGSRFRAAYLATAKYLDENYAKDTPILRTGRS